MYGAQITTIVDEMRSQRRRIERFRFVYGKYSSYTIHTALQCNTIFCWLVCLSHSRFLSPTLSFRSLIGLLSASSIDEQKPFTVITYAHTNTHNHTQTDIEFKPQADQAHLQLHAQLVKMVTLLNENRQIK